MTIKWPLPGFRVAGLLAPMIIAIMVLLAALLPAAARAQVIENVATAEYQSPAGIVGVRSNRVEVRMVPPRPPGGTILTYRVGSGPGQIDLPLGAPSCQVATTRSIAPSGAFSSLANGSGPVVPTTTFRVGEPVVITVALASANRDPTALDRLVVSVATENGDKETLSLVETAVNSGVFAGYVMTARTPPAPVVGDCKLSVPASPVMLTIHTEDGSNLTAVVAANFLIDPLGITFDSATGEPVSGARVTIVDTASGQPARVFGDDGVSSYPSTMISGSQVVDSAGVRYDYATGEYRFPFLAPGQYRLIIEPPLPYSAPSKATPSQLAGFRRPGDGQPFLITPSSYGLAFTLTDPVPVRIDIPLDRAGTPLVVRKTSSNVVAVPGDVVSFRIEVANSDSARATGPITVQDDLPNAFRLIPNSVRFDGVSLTAIVSADGRRFTIDLPGLASGATGALTYLAEVRADAREGDAINLASVIGITGPLSNVSDAVVRIRRDTLADRMTLIGRVIDGRCDIDPKTAPGVPNVRVMLEDGSYSITDAEGRYHFEGLRPGTHVVQVDPSTFPADRAPEICGDTTRSAGSEISRFIDGVGGSLHRADFRARPVPPREDAVKARESRAEPLSDAQAAGAERDWFAGQTAGVDWVFPAADYNPRTPAIRIAVKHLPGQSVRLSANGKPVDILAFDGARPSPDGSFAISLWRGVPIGDRDTKLRADIVDASGAVVQSLDRVVHYGTGALTARLIKDQSVLVADGVTRPVIAVRLSDGDGRPVRHGVTGEYEVAAPYYPAVEADAQQARQLAGLERARPFWRVDGDEGIAYVELEPTTASGTITIGFRFQDGTVVRQQRIETWLDPGDRPWTVVGFAEGTLGYKTLKTNSEPLGRGAESDDDIRAAARLALYAKGRVLGKWVMTLGIDSDRDEDEARFGGVIDPRAYYTIYADGSDRRYDAASVEKIYLKLERPQFYALFGDYETGIDEPVLARYQRSLNGLKAEYRGDSVAAVAFAADTPYRYRRDEIQGDGLTGPYRLSAQDILANSERIYIETRDRLRPELIVDTKQLLRHIDYDIDYLAGTLRFREPVLSRSSSLDPNFIVAEYEVDGVGQRVLNAGGRASWTSKDEKIRVGATAIHDETDLGKTDLGGIDARVRIGANTEVRAEFAMSEGQGNRAGDSDNRSTAWLVEAEHHGKSLDLLGYVRERDGGFGVGQLTEAGNGARKIGIDGRLRLTNKLSLAFAAADEDYYDTDIHRRTARALIEYQGKNTSLRGGLIYARDEDETGDTRTSNLVELGATHRLFKNRLELDAQTQFALGGDDENIDFPARHQLGARFAVTEDVTLVGVYEIAEGEDLKARTARIGFDLKPWAGARITANANNQDIDEYGPRSYAAFGFAQSLQLNARLTVDFSLDVNETLFGFRPSEVVDPAQPVAAGGFLAQNGALTEDFVAATAGATWRNDTWSLAGRAEYRNGDFADRYGFTASALRKLGEGRALGGLFSFGRAEADNGATTQAIALEASWANRPADSEWSWLEKLELREDKVRGGIAGLPGPIGGPRLTIDGDATSRRIVNSLSINYTPIGDHDDSFAERGEYSLFWGTRYALENFGPDDVEGWSNVLGADARLDLSERVDIGAQGTLRIGTDARNLAWSAGPTIGLVPFDNSYVALGYNFRGFKDRDFEDDRYTRSGPFVTFRLKFDQTSLTGVGL